MVRCSGDATNAGMLLLGELQVSLSREKDIVLLRRDTPGDLGDPRERGDTPSDACGELRSSRSSEVVLVRMVEEGVLEGEHDESAAVCLREVLYTAQDGCGLV